MPRTKNYLRYVHESTFGVVAASHAGTSIKYLRTRGTRDRFVAVPANESVIFWDLKTRQIVNTLAYDDENASEVTVLECFHGGHPRTNLIAAGYANGHIRLFEYETGSLKATFTGHRVAVTALAFDKDGSRLASGSKDCSIVLWDIVGERGMFSLRGHKNPITKLAFLHNEQYQKDLVVSSSTDAISTIKFWDLQLQHCFFTLPGQASGVWSFLLLRNGTRLVTGSSGPELKVYSLRFLSETERQFVEPNEDQEIQEGLAEDQYKSEKEFGLEVKPLGNILRNTIAIASRVHDLLVDPDESVMICHSTDKNVEFYGLRTDEEVLIYAKKVAKKAARKAAKRKRDDDQGDPDEAVEDSSPVTPLGAFDGQKMVDCEFNRKLGYQKLSDKVKAIDVVTVSAKSNSRAYKLACAMASNKIDNYIYDPSNNDQEEIFKHHTSIESPSHRSDVRCVAMSADNTLILSASAESAKLWRLDSRVCIATIETEYATCCTFANAQNLTTNLGQNKYFLLGTKQGNLQIIDVAETRVCETIKVCDNEKPLNSICVLPDQTGIVCGGEDGVVRFYNYVWKESNEEGGNQSGLTRLSLEESRTLIFQEGITCVMVSANNNLLAVSLLDSTVRVHFVDSLKYFLTMYGHKFPVTTMDISDDSTLLVTGSPDKNVKIWGLDFGDCHKSIFAHDDAITCVKFVPKTHHVFSCGRDKQIKQWDCDIFIKIQTLRRHMAEVWCLALSPNGKFLVSGSHDKSIRIFRKTEEILVPSEEDETERELADERDVFEKQENIVLGEKDAETGFAVKMTIETVKSTDRLIEAIDVFGSEQEKEREYLKQCQLAESKKEPRPAAPEPDPLLMTMMTNDYARFMLEILRRIKSSELEQILLTLPFDYVRKLLIILMIFIEKRWDIELMTRCATFLLKVNFGQIAASPTLSPVVHKLKTCIMDRTIHLRECTGFNLMALEHLKAHRVYQSSKKLQTIN